MFQSWNISEKVCGATTDNCGNIVNAVVLLGIEHIPCVAHTLQLSIKDGLAITRVQRILGRCRKLVEHFRKSTKETYKLWEKQKLLQLPEHKLTQECVTRWGSTLGMLQRLMEQQMQAAIAAVLMEEKVRHLMPESNEIEQLVEILKPFQHATEAMSGEKYPTVSTINPLLYKLVEKTLAIGDSGSTTLVVVKKAIKSDLQGRYQSAAVQRILNVAIYLDPRYKKLPFLDKLQKLRMIDDVKDELLALEIPENTEQEETSQESEEPPAKKKKGPVSKEICLQNRGKLHHILTVCQRKWSYTRLKSHLSSTQIPLSSGLNEGQSTL